jgi:Flp pilus assembly pilin Flp
MLRLKRNRKYGQTALEYALVIGVIAVGIVAASRFIFQGGKDSNAGKLFNSAVDSAQGVVNASNESANGTN